MSLEKFLIILVLVILAILFFIFHGTPWDRKKKRERIKALQDTYPGHQLRTKLVGWPNGDLMSVEVFSPDGKRKVGSFTFNTHGKWVKINGDRAMEKARYGGPYSILKKEEGEKNTQNRKPEPITTRSDTREVLRTKMRYEEICHSCPDEVGSIEIHGLKRKDGA